MRSFKQQRATGIYLVISNRLEEGGELLGHVALSSLVPQCNLLNGVL